MLNKKSVDDINVKGKRVLVRCDFNVPQDKETGVITDNRRIRAALPTIQYLLDNNAKVILCSHLGRPKGEFNLKYSLKPVAGELSKLLNKDVKLAKDVVGEDAVNLTSNINEVKPLNPKDIVMPTIEDNKPIINGNSELKNETVKTNNITSSNVVQNLTDDDDSYKASSSKLDNSSQNALNRFQNIASSIDKELTELENKQKTFNQKNANIENNNLNISNEPIKEEPKLVEEKKESNTTVVNNVYSSVYVPNNNQNIKDEEPKNNEEDIDETMSIELPKLKEEPILKDENPDKFNFI